tara:strand:- start:637 stop:888 length:252 start_codon:yes stop_codon:yes gene_type:complete
MGKKFGAARRKNKGSDDMGISNLGFFGGVGSMVTCDADDESFFCQLTKFTSMIHQFISLIGLLIIIYVIYKFIVVPIIFKKSR